MVEYLKFTPEMSNNWSRAYNEVVTERPWVFRRLLDASTESQMDSKLWLATELINVNIKPKNVALLGGWFAHIITSCLIDEVGVDIVYNYEIDIDAHYVSFKFNNRYRMVDGKRKYFSNNRNIMINSLNQDFDCIINTSCEHMFPMWKFRELNPHLKNSWYVLQSTDDEQYEDHINCVKSSDELIDQARFVDVLYSGSKVLSNGMRRFMVIGR